MCVKKALIWQTHFPKKKQQTKKTNGVKKAILFLDCLPEACVWNLSAIWTMERNWKKHKQTKSLDDSADMLMFLLEVVFLDS